MSKKTSKWQKVKLSKYEYHQIIYYITLQGKKVYFVECGYKFDPYIVIDIARINKKNPTDILKNILIVRSFTLYHLKTAVKNSISYDYIFISDINKLLQDSTVSEKEKLYFKEYLKEFLKNLNKNIFLITDKVIITNYFGGNCHGTSNTIFNKFNPEGKRQLGRIQKSS
jgi:SepF-like predicted cell division protein (DUF552 family)